MKPSDTQSMILLAAAQHGLGLAMAPKNLPAAARNAVFRSLLKNKFLSEINAPREYIGRGWRQDEDGTWIGARITDEGLRAIAIDPNEADAGSDRAYTAAPNDVAGEGARRETPDLTEGETQDALHRLDPLWEHLFPAEQARIVRSLVERVVIGPAGTDIRLRLDGLGGLVRDLTAISHSALMAA